MREKDDHFIFETKKTPNSPTGGVPRVTTPSKVLRINDAAELKEQLDHYQRPFLKHLVPDSKFARKHYVEKIRPALRYYCQKFQTKVPDWLKKDDYYLNLPDDEKKEMFGTTELSIKEFKPLVPLGQTQISRG